MDNHYNRINKNAVKAWLIGRFIGWGIFVAIYFVGVYLFLLPQFPHLTVLKYAMTVLTVIIGVISISETFVFPFWEYKFWRYGIFEDKIETVQGVIIKEKIIIPISRVQNLKIEQGPIQRIFGIVTIKIVTAGGDHEIPAITSVEADKITDNLKNVVEIGEKDE